MLSKMESAQEICEELVQKMAGGQKIWNRE